ncbi:hypothetical protein KJ966_02410 [bacterium]|nr:hypothetical protein [bacterium]
MVKKILIASACMVSFVTCGFAEKLTRAPIDLEIHGDLEAYYKMQNDYTTPLDSADYQEAIGNDWNSGVDYRDGANNRSQQTTRGIGNLTMVARGGKNDYNGKPWYNLIGVMNLKMDANDPDYASEEKKDGAYLDNVSLGDLWIRYSPAVMVGVKIGTQSIAATANMYGIGHLFAGDIDNDFIYWTSAALIEKPGISIDLHLAEGIELGAGLCQGMGDLSAIASGGSKHESSNTVIWLDGSFGLVDIILGNQTIAVGGTNGTGDEEIWNQWQHEETHSLTNMVIKVNIGDFSPFFAFQQASGNKVSATDTSRFEAYNAGVGVASTFINGLEEITVPSTKQDIILEMMTLGLVAAIGPGKLAFEYTTISTPDFGEDGSVSVGIEANSTIHLNYEYPLTDSATLVVFYNSFEAKESENLRDSISKAEKNSEILAPYIGISSDIADLAAGGTALANNLGAFKTSSTSSVGLAFKIKFGN